VVCGTPPGRVLKHPHHLAVRGSTPRVRIHNVEKSYFCFAVLEQIAPRLCPSILISMHVPHSVCRVFFLSAGRPNLIFELQLIYLPGSQAQSHAQLIQQQHNSYSRTPP
jgi:hypothetical protein